MPVGADSGLRNAVHGRATEGPPLTREKKGETSRSRTTLSSLSSRQNLDGGSQPGSTRRIKYGIRLGKAGQTNLGHLFCNLGHFRQLGALFGPSTALRRENVRFGCPKMLNGVVFTIFIPFSFLAISLYEMNESMWELNYVFHPSSYRKL